MRQLAIGISILIFSVATHAQEQVYGSYYGQTDTAKGESMLTNIDYIRSSVKSVVDKRIREGKENVSQGFEDTPTTINGVSLYGTEINAPVTINIIAEDNQVIVSDK
ncbi:MAG: hypothetical protein BWK78_03290 [Thiotrichaceae bacterium IS1]|nr:MAG: hypothetical protein BWK78_03290 [Thiotrichaceae bacterium IS1]